MFVMQLWNVGASVTDDGATLLISVFDGCECMEVSA